MVLPLKQRLLYFFPTLFCFCMPFGSPNDSRVLSGIIIAWVVVSLFNIDRKQLTNGITNKNASLLFLFFVITLISALFSKNKANAGFEIENKLSFILLPYLLFCFDIPIQLIKRCIVSFVSGCFFASLLLIIRASYYSFNGQSDYFFYTLFSYFIHPSYFAMYLILAIVLVVLFYRKWFTNQKSIVISSYFFVILFGITILLCGSKLGLISFVIIIPFLVLYQLKTFLNAAKIFLILFIIVILIVGSLKLFPNVFERLNSISTLNTNQLDKNSVESTAVRFLIWQEAIILIQNNFLLGTTVGDANDALYSAYKQNGLTGAFEHKLNAHNQFMQTFIGLGLIGFISLCLITVWQLIKAIKQKHFLLLIFSLLIILNFLVESMLQSMAGTLFFVFFYCIFNLKNKQQLLNE